jgi:malate dehydrogenase (oxaloacetate-decarboxylating)(NADP+)
VATSAHDWTAIFPDPDAAIEYHARAPAGKIGLQPTKPCLTQHDLALAYTPGVAIPCLCIKDDPDRSYELTGRGNLVAASRTAPRCWGWGTSGRWPASR